MQNDIGSKAPALFIDTDLRLRFFTPTAPSFFRFGPAHVGSLLSDLPPVSADDDLISAVEGVLRSLQPNELEIRGEGGSWFLRHVQPYHAEDAKVVGAAITYVDITDRKHAHSSLTATASEARRASLTKSRFLATACHDLRQPLQSMTLLHQLLTRQKLSGQMGKLADLMGQCLSSMTTMLDSMLDLGKIEAGVVQPKLAAFPIASLIQKLANEFVPVCDFKGLSLRTVPSNSWILTDPQLLEQMLRNLLSNAVKYTPKGGILLGCRRRGKSLNILVCDTGVGVAESDLGAIFDAYYQAARTRELGEHGTGLGLSIVHRLSKLLDHPVSIRSNFGRGSSFMITVPIVSQRDADLAPEEAARAMSPGERTAGSVLVVEDDRMVGALLAEILRREGHTVIVKTDAGEATAWATDAIAVPDVIISGNDLGGETSGLRLAKDLAEILGENVPVLILTGDVTSETADAIARANFRRLVKPVDAPSLLSLVADVIASRRAVKARLAPELYATATTVHVVEDDATTRHAMLHLFEAEGMKVSTYSSAEKFLEAPRPTGSTCLLVDDNLPGMSGIELIAFLREENVRFGVVVLTGHGDAAKAVAAMKAGASDFLEKPADAEELLRSVRTAIDVASANNDRPYRKKAALQRFSDLTERERDVMVRILEGLPNKMIAAELGINQRTVEHHRASVMKKTGAASLPELVRIGIAAELKDS